MLIPSLISRVLFLQRSWQNGSGHCRTVTTTAFWHQRTQYDGFAPNKLSGDRLWQRLTRRRMERGGGAIGGSDWLQVGTGASLPCCCISLGNLLLLRSFCRRVNPCAEWIFILRDLKFIKKPIHILFMPYSAGSHFSAGIIDLASPRNFLNLKWVIIL